MLLSPGVFAAAPTISGTPAKTVDAGNTYTFTPTATDADGDKLTFKIKKLPVWATFDSATGKLTGKPTGAQASVYSGISIQVTDNKTKMVSLPTFSITVVNSAPTISGNPPTQVKVGAAYEFTPVASDANNDPLTFSINSNKPAWAKFDTKTGKLKGIPRAKGIYKNIIIGVSDGKESKVLPAFSINVLKNTAPVISGTADISVEPDYAYSFIPKASDADNDPLTFSIANKPVWAAFNAQTGELSGRPSSANNGKTKGIVISVSDGTNTVALPAFDLVVKQNSAPLITGKPAKSITAGKAYNFTPTASDADKDALSFMISNLPVWAKFDTATGKLSGKPSISNVGKTQGIMIQVSDGKEVVSIAPFSIIVAQANSPPVISGTPRRQSDCWYGLRFHTNWPVMSIMIR